MDQLSGMAPGLSEAIQQLLQTATAKDEYSQVNCTRRVGELEEEVAEGTPTSIHFCVKPNKTWYPLHLYRQLIYLVNRKFLGMTINEVTLRAGDAPDLINYVISLSQVVRESSRGIKLWIGSSSPSIMSSLRFTDVEWSFELGFVIEGDGPDRRHPVQYQPKNLNAIGTQTQVVMSQYMAGQTLSRTTSAFLHDLMQCLKRAVLLHPEENRLIASPSPSMSMSPPASELSPLTDG
ncbi:hypothetical protein PM082_010137 [Marasmius tenuissimus]|nr:hypothetical protein PM082_010137 [Marasmius tenuissimus]